MAYIDIRNDKNDVVNEIRFADEDDFDWAICTKLTKNFSCSDVELKDENRGLVSIGGEQHARNLIKALEKAIELGWLE